MEENYVKESIKKEKGKDSKNWINCEAKQTENPTSVQQFKMHVYVMDDTEDHTEQIKYCRI